MFFERFRILGFIPKEHIPNRKLCTYFISFVPFSDKTECVFSRIYSTSSPRKDCSWPPFTLRPPRNAGEACALFHGRFVERRTRSRPRRHFEIHHFAAKIWGELPQKGFSRFWVLKEPHSRFDLLVPRSQEEHSEGISCSRVLQPVRYTLDLPNFWKYWYEPTSFWSL